MDADSAATNRSDQRKDRLLEIGRVLSSTLEIQPLLRLIIDVACELTDSEAASILLYDEGADELRFEAAKSDGDSDLEALAVPLDSSVAGWVFSNAMPLVIQDAASDERVYRKVDEALGFQTNSILGVPLMIHLRAIGVLEAVNKRSGRFTEDDLAVLETLGAQAAVAIENARLMSKLKDANEELKHLDGMKSDFIAIASHELRTPLGLILGHATFIADYVPADYREQMDVIVRSAMRLKEIIEDMSAIAHKDQGASRVRRNQFSLAQVIDEVTERFQAEAERKGVELSQDVPAQEALAVFGDREKIDLALTNLVRNAIAFTNKGGQVGIKAEISGGYVQVFVVDTGIGIPERDIERVFERFYQVESHLTRKHGGMGLGLSIAKAMVEMHNGQIWCESKEGVGSLFCFMLPATQEQVDAAAKVFKTA
ncbi:MAG TPA: GAF domain-containing sensor histidine kinase [Anaerolineales bacterium]|jgi:signal transduction histidine kinase